MGNGAAPCRYRWSGIFCVAEHLGASLDFSRRRTVPCSRLRHVRRAGSIDCGMFYPSVTLQRRIAWLPTRINRRWRARTRSCHVRSIVYRRGSAGAVPVNPAYILTTLFFLIPSALLESIPSLLRPTRVASSRFLLAHKAEPKLLLPLERL